MKTSLIPRPIASTTARILLTCAVAMALAACGKDESVQTAAPAGPAAPLTPPPSYAQRYEADLQSMGAQRTEQGLVVRLESSAFTADSSTLQPASTQPVDRVVDLLKERAELKLKVVPHADAAAGKTAKKLPQERALAVQELVVQRGVPKERTSIESATEAPGQGGTVELVLSDASGGFVSRVATLAAPAAAAAVAAQTR